MNVSNIEKKIKNLILLEKDIEISKFSTIQELLTLEKVTNNYLLMAKYAKDIIDFAQEKWKIETPFYKLDKNQPNKTLWIMITLDFRLLKISYDFCRIILKKEFKNGLDEILVLGKPGKKITDSMEIEPLFFENKIDSGKSRIPEMAARLYLSERFTSIKFLLSSARTDTRALTILPLNDLNIELNFETPPLKFYTFYPSITKSVENLIFSYISRMTSAILQDTIVNEYRQILYKSNKAIEQIQDNIDQLKRLKSKKKRAKEMQERFLSSSYKIGSENV